jgi:hypothetical protein
MEHDRFALYFTDEPNDDPTHGKVPMLDLGLYVKRIDPKVQLYIDYCPDTAQTIPMVAAVFDIICPQANSVEKERWAKVYRDTGKMIWTYQCNGPAKMLSPLRYYRRQLWSSWDNGFTGAGFWAYADTGWGGRDTPGISAWDDLDGAYADFAVVYESDAGPVTSRRWEAWREGVEDYEYLWILRDLVSRVTEAKKGDAAVKTAKRVLAEAPAAYLAASPEVELPSGDEDAKASAALATARRQIIDAIRGLLSEQP